MQYARVIHDSIMFRFDESMSPLRLIQNFGISYTLFNAVEFLSVIRRIREQASWARRGSKSVGRSVRELIPTLKAKIARSMDSMVRLLKKTVISAKIAVRLDWQYNMHLLTS